MEQVLGDLFFVLSYTGEDVAVNGALVLDEVCAFYGFTIFWYNFFMRLKDFLVKLLYGSGSVVVSNPSQLGDIRADNAELGGKPGQAPDSSLAVNEEPQEQLNLRENSVGKPQENSSLNPQPEGPESRKFFSEKTVLRLISVVTFLIWFGSIVYKLYIKFKAD